MKRMTPKVRKFVYLAHIVFSLGWLGAVVAYLAVAVAGLASGDADMGAAYLSMNMIGQFVIIPFSLATLLTGLVQSLGTEWGLFRHYWVATKFVLTLGAIIILLLHMPTVSRMSEAAQTALANGHFGDVRIQLIVHAVGGLLVLLVTAVLSVYKPWGRTGYGAV